MTTFHIEVDDVVATAIRERAQCAGKTPEAFVAEMMAQQALPAANKSWIPKFLEAARTSGANSGGWKWNREELYDR